MNHPKICWAFAATALLILAGCVSFKSTKLDRAARKPKRTGIAYSLPRAKLHITAVRLDPGEKAANESVRPPGQPAKPGTPPAPPPHTNSTPNAESAAPGQSAPLLDTTQQPPYYQITMEAVYEPDPQYTFLLSPTLRCTSDDTFQVILTNGLLSTVSSTNTDQSGEVVVELAKTAIEAFKLAAGIPAPFKALTTTPTPTPKYPKQLDVSFYPDDPGSIASATNLLVYLNNGKTEPLFQLTVTAPTNQFGTWTNIDTSNGDTFDGFFYRSVVPYTVTLQNLQEMSTLSKTFLLPNGAPILAWSPKRAALVKAVNRITLENGTLKEVFIDKPSTALATVKVPLTILQAIVALPTDLLQLKFNYSSTNKQLLDSQKAEIASLQALLEQQRAFLQYQATNKPPGSL